jgi:ABC-type multidrug transport system ATPase subunit
LVEELVGTDRGRVGILKEGRLVAFDTVSGLRARTGASGTFDEVYEALVGSRGLEAVRKYLGSETA